MCPLWSVARGCSERCTSQADNLDALKKAQYTASNMQDRSFSEEQSNLEKAERSGPFWSSEVLRSYALLLCIGTNLMRWCPNSFNRSWGGDR